MERARDAVASAALTGVGFTIVAASFRNPLEPLIGFGIMMALMGLFCLLGIVDRKYI